MIRGADQDRGTRLHLEDARNQINKILDPKFAAPAPAAPFDLGRVVIDKRYKLIYNALWQLPYQPVGFVGQPFWKEMEQMNREGKLSALHSRLLFSPTRSMFELFDLESDPHEFTNLSGKPEHAALEQELKAKLQEWMILERDYLPLPIPPRQ